MRGVSTSPPITPAATGGLKLRWQAVVTDAAGQTLLDTRDWTATIGEHFVAGDEATIRTQLESFFKREVVDDWKMWVRRYALERGKANNAALPRNPDFADSGPDEAKAHDWNVPIAADQFQPPDDLWVRKPHARVPWAPFEVRDGDFGTDLPPPLVVRDR